MKSSLDTRTFSVEDNQNFALISGDHNPLHVVTVAARRTLFGGVVAHGMHMALWALDVAMREIESSQALSFF